MQIRMKLIICILNIFEVLNRQRPTKKRCFSQKTSFSNFGHFHKLQFCELGFSYKRKLFLNKNFYFVDRNVLGCPHTYPLIDDDIHPQRTRTIVHLSGKFQETVKSRSLLMVPLDIQLNFLRNGMHFISKIITQNSTFGLRTHR